MTIRPVYERPRVVRTLLCLLVGVLALLWRAVPSFSWDPSSCPNWTHVHTMNQAGDYGYFFCVFSRSGLYPCDRMWMEYEDYQGVWRYMCPGHCICADTHMRYVTYGDPEAPFHFTWSYADFQAPINGYIHCASDVSTEVWFEPGRTSSPRYLHGRDLYFLKYAS